MHGHLGICMDAQEYQDRTNNQWTIPPHPGPAPTIPNGSTAAQIAEAFQRDDLIIYTNPDEFKAYIFNQNLENTAVFVENIRDFFELTAT